MSLKAQSGSSQPHRIALKTMAILIALQTLSGCLVAGYSSSGGFFVWPGSIVITIVLLLIFFFLRRGR